MWSWRFWLLLAPALAVALHTIVSHELRRRSLWEATSKAFAEAAALMNAPAPQVLLSEPAALQVRRSLPSATVVRNPFSLPEALRPRPPAPRVSPSPIDAPPEVARLLPNVRPDLARDDSTPALDALLVIPPPNPTPRVNAPPARLPRDTSPTDTKPRGVIEIAPPPSRPVPAAPIARSFVPKAPQQVALEIHVWQIALADNTWHGVDLSAIPAAGNGTPATHESQHQSQFAAAQLAPALQTLQTWGARPLVSRRMLVDSHQQAVVTADGATAARPPTVALPHGSLSVQVTPTVMDDGRIQIRLQPAIHDSTIRVIAGRSDDTVAALDATLLVVDGEAVLFGGLIHQRDVQLWNRPAGSPQTYTLPTRTETVIAIVPRIVSPPIVEAKTNHGTHERTRKETKE